MAEETGWRYETTGTLADGSTVRTWMDQRGRCSSSWTRTDDDVRVRRPVRLPLWARNRFERYHDECVADARDGRWPAQERGTTDVLGNTPPWAERVPEPSRPTHWRQRLPLPSSVPSEAAWDAMVARVIAEGERPGRSDNGFGRGGNSGPAMQPVVFDDEAWPLATSEDRW
jgi:hypothetical protein